MADGVVRPVVDRARLGSLRYAVNEEAVDYISIMRVFTGTTSGLLSDLSAAEVAGRLAVDGLELDVDTVDARLSYLVEHGNLARSPRETEARSIRDYLTNRARYQLTQRGELVHRQVEELLGSTEAAREVSSEMLGGLLAGLEELRAYDDARLAAADPDAVARQVGTLFAQFERLVDSTRDFYAYLSQVLVRYDLERDHFQAFKAVLLDYLQRFVDEVARHHPQIADLLAELGPRVPALLARANAGQRLVGLDGEAARRGRGLVESDWAGLRAWFLGEPGRASDADEVRGLATTAMRALLANLRRISGGGEREASRYGDLVRLARWFDESDDDTAHALWVAAFGLYPCRHVGFSADSDGAEAPPTSSWWRAPVADVPVLLRTAGDRAVRGRSGAREDFAAARAARLAEREAEERRRRAALDELAACRGPLDDVHLSDDARAALLELYARALSAHGGPLGGDTATAVAPGAGLVLRVRREPGRASVLTSPAGRLQLVDTVLAVEVADEAGRPDERPGVEPADIPEQGRSQTRESRAVPA
jgi:uncharacterized protein (TIGR02677 family)